MPPFIAIVLALFCAAIVVGAHADYLRGRDREFQRKLDDWVATSIDGMP